MVLGEVGQYPLELQAKCRMFCFWHKMAYNQTFGQAKKLSVIMYKFLYEMYKNDVYKSPYLHFVQDNLNGLGLNYFWENQFSNMHTSLDSLKMK